MIGEVAFIGFGEAGRAFALPGIRAFDVKTRDAASRAAKRGDYSGAGVRGCDTAEEALANAPIVFSLVTADQALAAARAHAPLLAPGALWLDMNSVAPGAKRAAAAAIEGAGGRYVDVAVMAPVLPGRLAAPLLLAGRDAGPAATELRAYGFTSCAIAGPTVGDAAAVKMIRSVLVKGLEALSAECMVAASRAGVVDPVLASLDASWREQDWAGRIDYNVDRMLSHGLRRAAEMEEAVRTLEDLGVDPVMTRGTVVRQRELGALGVRSPTGLLPKLAAITAERKDRAA